MELGDPGEPAARHRDDQPSGGAGAPTVPETNKGLMVVAGVLLLIPIVALMWVPSYNQDSPELWGFPFFFWYQFLWVILCSALTWTAYRLTLLARPGRTRRHRDAA